MCMCVGMYTLCAEIDGLLSANATEHCVHSCNSPQQSNKLFIPRLPRIAQTLGLIIGHCRAQPRHSKSRLAAEAQLEYNSRGHFHSRWQSITMFLTTMQVSVARHPHTWPESLLTDCTVLCHVWGNHGYVPGHLQPKTALADTNSGQINSPDRIRGSDLSAHICMYVHCTCTHVSIEFVSGEMIWYSHCCPGNCVLELYPRVTTGIWPRYFTWSVRKKPHWPQSIITTAECSVRWAPWHAHPDIRTCTHIDHELCGL